MFARILLLQRKEFGPKDRRCFVTIDKINMVRSRGTNFEEAVETLRNTFSVPVTTPKKRQPTPPQPQLTSQQLGQDLGQNTVAARPQASSLRDLRQSSDPHGNRVPSPSNSMLQRSLSSASKGSGGKPPKANKVLKVFSSMRGKKKPPAASRS